MDISPGLSGRCTDPTKWGSVRQQETRNFPYDETVESEIKVMKKMQKNGFF